MTEAARITQQEVQPLPRWARLAFATRCIRRARPLLRAPAPQVRILEDALARTEESARLGRSGDELAEAAASAYTLALDNLDGKAPSAGEPEAVVVTCMVAHATAFAAEAATLSEARLAAYLVAQSVDFAVHAFRVAGAANTAETIQAMRRDLQKLRDAVERQGWTDRSPVPPEVFGAL
jgi:hypothetical protein